MMMRKQVVVLFLVSLLFAGCRGYRTETSPFHLNPNLDWQAKFKAQSLSQEYPEGVVAWGDVKGFSVAESREKYLKADSVFYAGKTANGAFVSRVPISVTDAVMKRGQERFNIYCAVCHDQAGSGHGMVVQRGFALPPDFGDERLLGVQDGYIFDVITNGIRNMPAYGKQVPEADRWAIVAYVRALQSLRKEKK